MGVCQSCLAPRAGDGDRATGRARSGIGKGIGYSRLPEQRSRNAPEAEDTIGEADGIARGSNSDASAGAGASGSASTSSGDSASGSAGGIAGVDREIGGVTLSLEQYERWEASSKSRGASNAGQATSTIGSLGTAGSKAAGLAGKAFGCVKVLAITGSAAAKTDSVVVPFCTLGGAVLDLAVAHLETVAANNALARKAKDRLAPWKQVLEGLFKLNLIGSKKHYQAMILAIVGIEDTAYKWVTPRQSFVPARSMQFDLKRAQTQATTYSERFEDGYATLEEARKVLMMSLAEEGLLKQEDMQGLVKEGLVKQDEIKILITKIPEKVAEEVAGKMTESVGEAVRKEFREQSYWLAMIPADAVVYNLLPLPETPVGRNDDLDRVEAALNMTSGLGSDAGHAKERKLTVGEAAIIGVAGVGKSTLAMMAAYEALDRATESHGTSRCRHLVGVIRAATVDDLKASFIELLDTMFGWAYNQLAGMKAQDLANTLMKEIRKGNFASWLLVIDNIPENGYGETSDETCDDTPRLGYEGLEPHFFSSSALAGMAGKGNFLFTCRAPVFFDKRDVRIEPLDDEDGARLLLADQYDDASSHERLAAKELSWDLGGLPLALETSRQLLAKKYRYGDSVARSFKLLKKDLKKASKKPVIALLSTTLEYVRSFPSASAALDVASFLSPDGFPLRMVLQSSEASVSITQDDVNLLVDLGLLHVLPKRDKDARQRRLLHMAQLARVIDADAANFETNDDGEPEYSMHRLVQEVAREGRTIWRAVAVLGAMVSSVDLIEEERRNTGTGDLWLRNWAMWRQGDALTTAWHRAQDGMGPMASAIDDLQVSEAREIVISWGCQIDDNHALGEFISNCRGPFWHFRAVALAVILRANAELKTLTSTSLGGCGQDAFDAIGKALSTNTTLRSLELSEGRTLSISDEGATAVGKALEINTALHSLALPQSDICNEGAAAIGKGLGSNTALQTLDLRFNNIGDEGAAAIGKGLGTNAALQKLNLDFNKIGNEGATAFVTGLGSNVALKTLELSSKDFGHARATREFPTDEAKEQFTQTLGKLLQALCALNDRAFLVPLLTDVGRAHQRLDQAEEALQAYGEAARMGRATLGEAHENVVDAIERIGEVNFDTGSFDEALKHWEDALQLQRRALGDGDHRDLVGMIMNVGVAHERHQQFDEALIAYGEAARMGRATLGETHKDVAIAVSNMGNVHFQEGRFDEALDRYREALRMRRAAEESSDEGIADLLQNIGHVQGKQGAHQAALESYQQSLDLRRKALGDDHPHVASSLNDMSACYIWMGRYDEALAEAEKTTRICRAALASAGDDQDVRHDLGIARNNIGEVSHGLRRFDEAITKYEEALGIFAEAGLPDGHERPTETRDLLERARRGDPPPPPQTQQDKDA